MPLIFTRDDDASHIIGEAASWQAEVVGLSPKPEISATRDGVYIRGLWPILDDCASIEAIKGTLEEAMIAHKRMAREDVHATTH